ncbi:MAG: PAS domain-containing sensor histidine kinase [Acidimicrobiia bacterium]|nr:PAS domain-containing sensor histidine kinase [Acidimicrobiia bacterium]
MSAIDTNAYHQLFEAMPVAALLVDDHGTCLDTNPAAVKILGPACLDPTWNVFDSDILRGDELDRLVDSIRSTGTVESYDATVHGSPGSRLVHISGHRVFNEPRQQHVTWLLLGDVADNSAAAYQLARLNRQLEDSNRQLDQFASMAAHDLKAPARRVRMFAQLLDNDPTLSESSRGFVHRIHTSGSQMEEIVDSLLQFARVDEGLDAVKPANLRQLLQRVCTQCAHDLEEAGYEIRVGGTYPTVSVDAVAIEQLFQNLVSNAVKFRRRDVSGVLTVTSRAEPDLGGDHVIVFSDNGVGFPERDSEQVFEMLYRAHNKSEFEGNGIGLAICRRVCRAHGWVITAQSPGEYGASFRIVIPKSDLDDYHRR